MEAASMAGDADWFGWPLWSVRSLASLSFVCGSMAVVQHVQECRTKAPPSSAESKPQAEAANLGLQKRKEFQAFQRSYLVVYLIVMLADWLQGTNMYTLYQSYGVDIGTLFITGFTSSLVFGTFLGILVDRMGRRNGCLLFCVLELVINWLEHFSHFHLLLLGRVLGGISTSLLFSAFESWMVSEHRKHGFPEEWLVGTFSLASVGNGLVAIIAGIIAQVAADYLGEIGPFQLAMVLTAVALLLILRWDENYGTLECKHEGAATLSESFAAAWTSIRSDRRVLLLGLVQAFFEGAMYTFVFMWVPTLMQAVPKNDLPTGIVFSCFMICITMGGIFFKWMVGVTTVEAGSVVVFLIAAASMLVPVYAHHCYVSILLSFLALEVCVGMFFACAATMRSEFIPDNLQAGVMNFFRVPLNLLVVVGTRLSSTASTPVVFTTCSLWFIAAALCQYLLMRTVQQQQQQQQEASSTSKNKKAKAL